MPRALRYAATIYFGLLMSGTLARPGMARSAVADPPTSPLMKLAPQKAPYRYHGPEKSPDVRAAAAQRVDDLLR